MTSTKQLSVVWTASRIVSCFCHNDVSGGTWLFGWFLDTNEFRSTRNAILAFQMHPLLLYVKVMRKLLIAWTRPENPSTTSFLMARWFGKCRLLLIGLISLLVSAVGITVALNNEISIFVIGFNEAIDLLSWVIADIFPDYGRATVTSISMGLMWLANLAVGMGYPYISTELDNLAYVPFAIIVALSLVFMYFLVPDTAGKTNAEIQEELQNARAPSPSPDLHIDIEQVTHLSYHRKKMH